MMKNIAAALLKVQQDLDPVKKGKKGHNNKYADLPAVLDEAVAKLNEHGIVVLQPIQPASQTNHARVETILLHAESGESLSGCAEVPWRSESKMNDAQSYGSAVTYARRYSLVSILGISTEDDDGQSAYSKPKAEPTAAEREAGAIKWANDYMAKRFLEKDAVGLDGENGDKIAAAAKYPKARVILEAAGVPL
jgi:hypothetical protein